VVSLSREHRGTGGLVVNERVKKPDVSRGLKKEGAIGKRHKVGGGVGGGEIFSGQFLSHEGGEA